MKKIKIGIVGVAGYTGEELLKILVRHRFAEVASVSGSGSTDLSKLSEHYPDISGLNLVCEKLDIDKVSKSAEVVFLALPHGVSLDVAPKFLKNGIKVIDLSADFRLKDADKYEKWYKKKHTSPELLAKAVYGLPEIYRESVKTAELIANPGCYPTTILLGILPAIKSGLIDNNSIIADSKSGISGAGRKAAADYYKMEYPNFRPYNVGGTHRHISETEQELSKAAGSDIAITFTPNILPDERGMMSSIYANLKQSAAISDIVEIYKKYYSKEPFVRVLEAGKLPQTKMVVKTNFCEIGLSLDERTGKLIVFSAIDNLVKGASGQAVQNMNIMFGIDEKEGLC